MLCRVNQDKASRILTVTARWKTLPVDDCDFVLRPVVLVVDNLVNSRLLTDLAGFKVLTSFRSH